MPERISIRAGGEESVLWIGRGVLDDPKAYLVSPSGRWLVVASHGARAVAGRLRDALSGNALLDLEIEDSEEAKTLDAVRDIADRAIAA
ncbi:MAG TPA: hypothetical protein VIY96_07160, partial [Thermoanaerobaculia bacterium]